MIRLDTYCPWISTDACHWTAADADSISMDTDRRGHQIHQCPHISNTVFSPKKTIAVNACQATAMEYGHQIHQCPQSLIRYKGDGHGWP